MIIDTHIHESKYSGDSLMTLEEVVDAAINIGLDGICITDHESMEIKSEALALSNKKNFPIIVGAEFLTYEGDVLVFGLDSLPDEKIHLNELLDMVDKCGGVAIAAHPYRKNNRGLEDNIKIAENLHGVECLNGSTPKDLNYLAYKVCLERGLATFGGSDSHITKKVGCFATEFLMEINNLNDFIYAVKNKLTRPVMYSENGFVNIENYLCN
ncbi:MAG: PHP domain-containing protein [Clostridium sp.]|uniref:PHP domain-containing protein n=1 Tax=Clostridium sp. TaxID=1506 RepID=UPI002FC90285